MKKLAILLLVFATTISSAFAQSQQASKGAPQKTENKQSAPTGKQTPAPSAGKGSGVSTYKTFIYTSNDLAEDIQRETARSMSRGGIADAALLAAKGLAGGYVTSFWI